MSFFRNTLTRVSPISLLFSLIVDIGFYLLFKPEGEFQTFIYILFLPGWDLLAGILSFWTYVRLNRPNGE
jgi:uncharacterized membrane protein HdeD (DUF308 family)